MEQQPLYTARLVVRFVEAGQPYLASQLWPGSMPLNGPVAAIVKALWDRRDHRPLQQRLAAPGVPEDADYRNFLLDKLTQAHLLLRPEVDEAAAWVKLQQQELQEKPLVDQVELTNACPFTCIFCPRGLGKMQRPIGHLDLGLLEEIVAQVSDLEQRKPFGLHHFGEPLLHPDPARAVKIVADAGLAAEISLNPILLKPEVAEAILDAGVGVVIVSMDGLDTTTLQQIRGKPAGDFAEVESRVENLIKLVATMDKPPTVMISMVATKQNQHQWKQLFQRYKRWQLPWLTPVVRLLEDFGDPDIQPTSVMPLRQLCGSPYKFVSILWDGTVVPCCHDYNGEIVYGNLRQQSLEQIWKGDKLAQFRQRWAKLQFTDSEPCARCNWRVDYYMDAPGIAETDAWTEALW